MLSPLSRSWLGPQGSKLGGRGFHVEGGRTSRESAHAGLSAVTGGRPRAVPAPCAPGQRARRRGVLPGAAPGPAPAARGALGPAGPADMLPLSEEVRGTGERWVEGPKWPLHIGAGRADPSPSGPGWSRGAVAARGALAGRPLGSDLQREEAACQVGVWPSGTTGALLGSLEERNPSLSKRLCWLFLKRVLFIRRQISHCSFPTVTMFLSHCTLDLYVTCLIFSKVDIIHGGVTVIDNSDKATLVFFLIFFCSFAFIELGDACFVR